jgi:hypothetical protein
VHTEDTLDSSIPVDVWVIEVGKSDGLDFLCIRRDKSLVFELARKENLLRSTSFFSLSMLLDFSSTGEVEAILENKREGVEGRARLAGFYQT